MVGVRPRMLLWRLAEVVEVVHETPRTKSLVLEVPGWEGHKAGQHVDVRLTAEDGYQAQRSYSIASAPEDQTLMLTVERLEDGEVSPYLTDVLMEGDKLELRGPIGGYFAWEAQEDSGPLLLVAGGSGVVPLMAMIRHKRRTMPELDMRLVYSVRHADDAIYADELGDETTLTYTRDAPDGWAGHTGHIDAEMLRGAAEGAQLAFVCGSNGFVEAASELLLEVGMPPAAIRTERYGDAGEPR
jgi:ferredoxin-NADP reductase